MESLHVAKHRGAAIVAGITKRSKIVAMNGTGTYSGSRGFDLEALFGHQQQHHQFQHEQHQQQERRPQQLQQQTPQSPYGMPAPCFEGYDPSQNIGLHTGIAYNPTAHLYIPSPQHTQTLLPPTGSLLEPIPIGTRVLQRHHQPLYAAHASYELMDPMSTADTLMSTPMTIKGSNSAMHLQHSHSPPLSSYATLFSVTQAEAARKENSDLWLDKLQINVLGLALDPLSGAAVLKRVRGKTDDVVTRYLPCVEFLVSCQQELRAGLQEATQKRLYRSSLRDTMTPKQFFSRYLEPLPEKFYNRNKTLMECKILNKAYSEIKKLCEEAKLVEYQGCEVMKNTFLGGIKDGESWGLRKWLSMEGGALQICNDLECILNSCQKLDRSNNTTTQLSDRLRPLAKQALERLKNDVPGSYQEISTAHPYLPFFHRLESALKSMSNFDPEDDDVICLDDDEIEEEKKRVTTIPLKRSSIQHTDQYAKRAKLNDDHFANVFEDDDVSIVEVLDLHTAIASPTNFNQEDSGLKHDDEWICSRCSMLNPAGEIRCCMCGKTLSATCDSEDEAETSAFNKTFAELEAQKNITDNDSLDEVSARKVNVAAKLEASAIDAQITPSYKNGLSLSPLMAHVVSTEATHLSPADISRRLEKLVHLFDIDQPDNIRPNIIQMESFWDMRVQYACALRLFLQIICHRESHQFLDPVDERHLILMGHRPYASVIKHPLCFRDIVCALLNGVNEQSHGEGQLPPPSLGSWNMWRGMDLLHAIDLVFLNSLAYNGKERTKERSQTNKLRRKFWEGINEIIASHVGPDVERRRMITPTRRGESSGFVVRK